MAGVRSSCDAIATKFAFNSSSCTVCSWSRARSIASATRSATSCSSSTSSAREPAVDERPDVDHAQRVAGDKQRHSEHRLDPLLAQNRVEHVGVIDVGEDHRLPLGRDPAREAAADRDANALLDLLLDPNRGSCDQLVGSLVDEEHRARVRFEDVADAREQHGEQVVELEVRERRIRDGLHVLDPLPRSALRLEGPCMLDCDRCPVTGELQQLHVALVEHPVRQRPDVENAEHAAADEQRNAEHRLDPLLAQDRIEHVRVIDVIEDHRPPVRCDAAREAAADRDANALLDLLLDPDRCPRDELVRLLVEQQDGARVDAEDLAGAEKERR